MELTQIAENVYACLQEDKGFGWNNSGFVNLGGGLVVDTFYDLARTRHMIKLYASINPDPATYLVNTHHNGDHTYGNQLFKAAKIIGHRLCAAAMEQEDSPALIQEMISSPDLPPEMRWVTDDLSNFNFADIEITPPNVLVEDRLDLDLDGTACQIIYVGPAHTASDLIVYLPKQGVVFGGDVLWNKCTPVAWEGSHLKWLEAIDLVLSFDPEVIVPGHGPLCGVKEVKELRRYFEFLYTEARSLFDEGLSSFEASKRIDLGPYAEWTQPERMTSLIGRAFREFKKMPWDSPVDVVQMYTEGYNLRLHWETRGE